MIYIGTKEEWHLHAQLGAELGLAMSPGKAYFHRKYANINSVSCIYDLGNPNSTPLVVKFLNVGLFVGNHKVMGKVGDDNEMKETTYCDVIDKVVEGALPGKQADILAQYLNRHSKSLAKETRGRNLFIPASAGGMGQTAPFGFKVYVTKKQREIAGRILERNEYLIPDVRPLPCGREVRDADDIDIDPLGLVDVDPTVIDKKKGPQTDSHLFHGFISYRT